MDAMSDCRWVIPQHRVHAFAPEENPKSSISYRILCSSGMSIQRHASCASCLCKTDISF